MTIPRVPSSVILLPFLRMDFQQRQIAFCPAQKCSKKYAILGRAIYTFPVSVNYGTFFRFYQEGKKNISMKNAFLYSSNVTMRLRMLGKGQAGLSILGAQSEEHSCRFLRLFRH